MHSFLAHRVYGITRRNIVEAL